jgi:iron complex outermembrane receptor protein
MYDRKDLLASPGLISGYKNDFSFNKKFKTVFTPHIALQKTYENQIFNLSYSEGYNAPTSASSFNDGLQKASDDLRPERAKMWDLSVQGLLADTKFDYQVSVFRINVKEKSMPSKVVVLSAVVSGTEFK